MRIVLLSTYDLGRQPYSLALADAYLTGRGHHVQCVDTTVARPDGELLAACDLVVFYLPMHTATRLALPWIRWLRDHAPRVRRAAFGLYATINRDYLRELGVHWIAAVPLDRNRSVTPRRDGLASLDQYAKLRTAQGSLLVAYTEASYGCRHRCRHCPVVPVYRGVFRTVRPDTVLADVRQQIEQGARHVTFGDPDFFNGPGHAIRVVESLHREFPTVTYDVTIKIEHLLRHRRLLPILKATSCLFITSAVESLDDRVLGWLEKGHTRRDFEEAADLVAQHGLTLSPTFIAFHPWTTLDSYRDLLATLVRLNLVENTASIQLALRLLITANSRLLELAGIRDVIEGYDPPSLLYRWRHPDPAIDALASQTIRRVGELQRQGYSRTAIFAAISNSVFPEPLELTPQSPVPYLEEPWYCCAEPMEGQLAAI